jgi:glycosyltransferase involved in cell wall biosynthesis
MPDFLIFTALVPRLLGARLLLDIHDPMPEVFMSKFGSGRKSRAIRLMELQERWSARLAHAIITANERFRMLLIERGESPDKITVVNNLADPRIFRRDLAVRPEERRSFTLLYPGTIAPRYGLDVAVKALPALARHIPNLRLRIIGADSSHRAELGQLAAQLGVTPWIEFGGVVPLHEVPREMLQASIGIYPARLDPHMAIATPSKVLEYAAMGLPVVASRLPILTDSFSPAAVRYFEPGNVDEFAQCIIELYDHPEQRAALVREADREYVARSSWAAECSRYLALIGRLLQKEQTHARA